jgi:hypothetical protein
MCGVTLYIAGQSPDTPCDVQQPGGDGQVEEHEGRALQVPTRHPEVEISICYCPREFKESFLLQSSVLSLVYTGLCLCVRVCVPRSCGGISNV